MVGRKIIVDLSRGVVPGHIASGIKGVTRGVQQVADALAVSRRRSLCDQSLDERVGGKTERLEHVKALDVSALVAVSEHALAGFGRQNRIQLRCGLTLAIGLVIREE